MLRKGLDLSRPDVLFLLIWAGTTWLAYEDLYLMTFDKSTPITVLIGANIVSFFAIHAWTARHCRGTGPDGPPMLAAGRLDRLNLYLFAGWLGLFAWIVVKSGGVPLWWRLRHLDRSGTLTSAWRRCRDSRTCCAASFCACRCCRWFAIRAGGR